MIVEVRLPQWGMGMQEGTIVKWLKFPGDHVEKGEALLEVESAKVTDVLEAPSSGTIARLLAADGETVAVQTVVAEIDSDA